MEASTSAQDSPVVLVSHAASDRRWAEWLAWRMQAGGFEPLLEGWYAVPGVNRLRWLNESLVRADHLVLVLSESYLAESGASLPWQSIVNPTDRRVRLVPVKVDECSPPGLLAGLVTIDLVGLDEENAAATLLSGLGATIRGSAVPTVAPPFPGVSFPGGRPLHGGADVVSPPRELPPATRFFTGRQQEIAELMSGAEAACHAAVAGASVVLSVHGMAGVGKTALALRVAHDLADRFPDGCLFLDLHGATPSVDPIEPDAALGELLRRVGVPGAQIPPALDARAALYRGRLAGTRTLVVLDNARSAEQVLPLLPAASGCLVIVTSRRRLAALDEARSWHLAVLSPEGARDMLTAVVGADRLAGQDDATTQLVDLCGRLPLALRIAAARLRTRPAWSVADLADRLADHHDRLAALADGERGVAAAFAVSYRDLTGEAQRMLRRLGLHPGVEMDTHAAAALTGVTPAQADRACEHLLDVHLLLEAGRDRYRFHDLVRAFARERAGDEDSESLCLQSTGVLFDHYVSTAAAAVRTLFPTEVDHLPQVRPLYVQPRWSGDRQGARHWLDLERANLVRVAAQANVHGWRHALDLAAILFRYLDLGAHLTEAAALYTDARDAARTLGDHAQHAHVLTSLASISRHQGRYADAAVHAREALTLFQMIGDERGESRALTALGIIYWRQGRYDEALTHNQRAFDLCQKTGDRRGQARALGNIGHVHWRQGRYILAIDHQQRALELHRLTGDTRGQAHTLGNLGNVYCHQGDHALAVDHHRRALALYLTLPDRNGEADALTNLGLVHHAQGRHDDAERHHRQALDLYEEIGDCNGQARAHNGLAEHLHTIGHPEQARHHHALALTLTLATQDSYEQARSHAGLGRALDDLGNHDTAREHWRSARDIYAALDVPEADEANSALKMPISTKRTSRIPASGLTEDHGPSPPKVHQSPSSHPG
ncbi:tetratricopeptide repeat protein [Frankia sp. Cj3]|uniref:ATP-binding protein n=1 Tax=Frankia sp. Cj3 TaxID=2880976 RepID=UPI001EF581E8|nr:tetratricopeptide repeat protein [Frankia sp. Cj3]